MSIKAKHGRAQSAALLLQQGSLHKGTGLASLMHKAQLLAQAQRHLIDHLPAELHEHVFVGGYHEGRLTIITDRAVWLTWLRFEQARLLELLRQLPAFESIMGLTFKVRPIRPLRFTPQKPRQLSTEAAHQLEECAKDIEDPKLQKALKRLASHAARSSQPD
ncbi:DUF721 domain-containing protein [Phytohalomonas tamaricis]|uniref:DUF721 domain-containing protein n=1 Tax=Phytohalomonas tamaricis TaxID=2081032 RepID=UPI000D0B778C|nr:DciA family protein [Phytohalomonas tamaricis]